MSSGSSPKFRGKEVDLVIDVRSRLEHWMGHLPGSVCIPVDRLPDGLQGREGVTNATRILVYCASGARSALAADALKRAGYRQVIDGGGLSAARADFTP